MNEDKLTGLQDRHSFLSRLKIHCQQSVTMGHLMGLMVVDVNRFHRINEQFGFQAGDEALCHVANLIKSVARKKDLVARIGGDQFAVILQGIMNEGHAVLAAAKLTRLLEASIQLDGHKVVLSASIGVTLSPIHTTSFDRMLALAERASRQAGLLEEPYHMSSGESRPEDDNAISMEFELESAFTSGDLGLHYQPKVDLQQRRPIGAEALMRWRSGIRGAVSPEKFIAAGERAGLINAMTQWALNSALQFAGQWPDDFGPQSMAVNLSAAVLADPNLVDNIKNSLGIWEVPASALILEVTESTALADPEVSFKQFQAIGEMGVRVSLDDFGTGHSSLAWFRDVPAHELKLDKLFVARMVENEADLKVAELVINLAHSFGMTVVAEGIETVEACRLLTEMGCDYGQGYFIARPMSQFDFLRWLHNFKPEHLDREPKSATQSAANDENMDDVGPGRVVIDDVVLDDDLIDDDGSFSALVSGG
ncbi:MAG: bifunctional diguanylate cyclase/phosphodiesterase [Pseudomonadota bacterium]